MINESITSRKNPQIQHIKKLLSSIQYRQSEQEFVIEGVRLVEEAVREDWKIVSVFYSEKLNERGKHMIEHLSGRGIKVFQVSDQVMGDITETETPQGVVAVLRTRRLPLSEKPSLF